MRYLTAAVAILLVSSMAHSQCSTFYDIQNGSMIEQTTYDSKGKKTGKQIITFSNFQSSGSGYSTVMNVESFDKNDSKIADSEMGMTCEDGTIKMDMSKFLNQEQMKAFENFDVKIDAENLEMPSTLNVGQSLPAAKVIASMSGPMSMTIETVMSNRKVEGKESITTPVGTFDCYKISYDISVKTVMKMEMRGEEYWSENVGVVKSISYKSNGKKMSETVLTAYTR